MLRTALLATTAAALLVPASALAAPGWSPAENVATATYVNRIDAALGGERSVGISWVDRSELRLADGLAGTPLRVADPVPGYGDIDGDDSGTLTAAWTDGTAVKVATRPAGGAFGAPQTLAGAAGDIGIDVSPGGTTIVAWRVSDGLRARIRPAGGSFGPELVISGPGTNDAVVAVADSGEAIAAWTTQDNTALVKVRPPGGAFPAGASGFGTLTSVDHLALAMNARGDAQLAFVGNGADGKSRFGGGHRGPGEAFTFDGAVSEPIMSFSDPTAAVGPDGEGLVAWVSGPAARASVRSGDDYAAPETLTTHEDVEAGDAVAAIAADGSAFVGWDERDEAAGTSTLQLARRTPGQAAFGAPAEFDPGSEYVGDLRLRANGAGDVLAAWQAENDAATTIQYTLWRGEPRRRPVPPADVPAPAAGRGPGTAPSIVSAPRSAPASASRVARLRALNVRRRGGRALVRFTLSAPAKVTLTLERRHGRRWKATTRKVIVRAKGGKAAATLSLRGLRGRLRVVAKVTGAPGRTVAAVPAVRRR